MNSAQHTYQPAVVNGVIAALAARGLPRPSQQQQDVLDWYENSRGSLNVVARAGCGKTTMLKMLVATIMSTATPATRVFVGAYNKPIADEVGAALKALGFKWPEVESRTWHSAGSTAWRKVAPRAIVDKNKVKKLFDGMMPMPSSLMPNQKAPDAKYKDIVTAMVSLAKQRAFGVTRQFADRSEWFDIIDHFGLDESADDEEMDFDHAVTLAIRLYKLSLDNCRDMIDYDDMILAPLYFKVRIWQYDVVMVDEAQDTNEARRALALKILKPGGRLIAVGDDRQAIYGFTGADANSMDLIRASLNSAALPLNRTRRCPRAVVGLAQTWVPDIQATDDAPEGIARTITMDEFSAELLLPTDAILCRKCAPLVDLAYSLIRRGIACKVEGRDIGEGLLKLAAKFNVATLETLVKKLDEYRDRETQKWLAKEREEKAANVADSVETLLVIVQALQEKGEQRVDALRAFIKSMFKNSAVDEDGRLLPQTVVTLSTIHKAKGREWNRVYLLGRNAFMPSRWARKDWQLVQEDNLVYVAVTRAKQEFVDVIVEEKR